MAIIDNTQAIARRAGAFFSGTMLSRISGMIRDILMAWAFGASAAVAAFMVAFRFSNLLRRILAEGAMQTAFIPQFVAAKRSSEEKAFDFFHSLTHYLTWLLVAIIGIAEIGLAFFVLLTSPTPETRFICLLTMIMLPGLLFICLAGINSAFLQCEGRYFIPGIAPVAFNLVWIVAVLLLAGWVDSDAMPWLAAAVTGACFAQWMMTVPSVSMLLPKQEKRANWSDLSGLMAALSLGILGVSSTQINSAVDAIFAAFATAEGPAYLWYAIRLQQVPLSLFGVALSGALLPSLSRAIKAGDLLNSRHYLDFAIRKSSLLILPAAFGLYALGLPAINLLFGHGDFSSEASYHTALCLWGYAFGLPAAVLVLLYGPGFYSSGDYATPTRGVIYAVLLSAGLNYLAVCHLNMGPHAVAITTSLAAWLNACYLHGKLVRRWGVFLTKETWWNIAHHFVASAMACLVTLSVSSDSLSRNILEQLVECGRLAAIFGVVFFLTRQLLVTSVHKLQWTSTK